MDDDLPGHRAQQPAIEPGVPAMSDDDVVDAMALGVEQQLLRGCPTVTVKVVLSAPPASFAFSGFSNCAQCRRP